MKCVRYSLANSYLNMCLLNAITEILNYSRTNTAASVANQVMFSCVTVAKHAITSNAQASPMCPMDNGFVKYALFIRYVPFFYI